MTQAWATSRWDRPCSNLSRRISRIFLTRSLRVGIASPSVQKAKDPAVRLPMSAHDPGNWVIQFGRKRSTSAEIGDPHRPKYARRNTDRLIGSGTAARKTSRRQPFRPTSRERFSSDDRDQRAVNQPRSTGAQGASLCRKTGPLRTFILPRGLCGPALTAAGIASGIAAADASFRGSVDDVPIDSRSRSFRPRGAAWPVRPTSVRYASRRDG